MVVSCMGSQTSTPPTRSKARVEPKDITATILHCLGLSPTTEYHDDEGRPLPLSRGRVIDEIL